MTHAELLRVAGRLEEFLERCFEGMGRLERRRALKEYIRGLMLDGERKSMEPMASRLAGDLGRTQAIRQRMQQAVTVARWDEGVLYERLARRMAATCGIDALVIDDTGFPKQGRHSVGVQRQYSGTLGRTGNCQVATSLHVASEMGGGCIGMRLYLPKAWTDAPERRAKAGVPDDIVFEEKWRLALGLLDRALSWGLEPRPVLTDSAYGDSTEFRAGLEERQFRYIVGVTPTAVVWPPGTCPTPPPPRPAHVRGRTFKRWSAPKGVKPVSMLAVAQSIDAAQYRRVSWRNGNRDKRTGRFAAVRIRTARRNTEGRAPGPEQWLLCEWPRGADKPTKCHLSNLPAATSLRRLVYLAKLRWRVERDYQEMKGELGLDHYEGRGWVGFHHHMACVSAAHAFLTLDRALSPPVQTKSHLAAVPSRPSAGSLDHARALPHVRQNYFSEVTPSDPITDVIK